MGSGTLRRIKLDRGFYLQAWDYRLKEALVIDVEGCLPSFGFGFCVSGETKSRGFGMRDDFIVKSGQTQIFCSTSSGGSTIDAANSHRLAVSVVGDPDVFRTMLADDLDSAPRDFRNMADGSLDKNFYRSTPIEAEMYTVLNQVLNHPDDLSARRLYLQGKAMELVALGLNSLAKADKPYKVSAPLSLREQDKIHQAAERLTLDLEEPPSLFALSNSVGLSHVKLNRGFRQVFDTTVFGYLRRMRLQKAKRLLETHQMNVTEAAFAVGYNSLSSFSRAFYGQYGVKPNACLRDLARI
jgi:AraC-like DNA-binding protein